MRASEIREKTSFERTQLIKDLTEELFNLRFQHGIGQLEKPSRIKDVKRDIARIKTIARESELGTAKSESNNES